MGNYGEAIKCYSGALEIFSDFFEARKNIKDTLKKMKEKNDS